MALVFGSKFTLNGNGSASEGPWNAPVQRNSAFGVPGSTVLTGARTDRSLVFDVWIYNSFATETDLKAAVDAVEAVQNEETTLTVDSQSYGRCLFDGLAPRQPRARINSPNLGWLWVGQARFTQLQP
jgi:hypothetical protein